MHSKIQKFQPTASISIVQVPMFEDNYTYLIHNSESSWTAAVDPADPQVAVKAMMEHLNVESLNAVLTTHHHWDHAGGNEELANTHPKLKIYGFDKRIPNLTHPVEDGQIFQEGGLQFEAIFTPCHTNGHVTFFLCFGEDVGVDPVLFSGDTLFVGGCGRFFEGTAQQMQDAMDKLAKLPPSTTVFCGHEYTVSNLVFGLSVDPDNEHLKQKLKWAKQRRHNHLPTVPSTIAEERLYNPFMRTRSPAIAKAVAEGDSEPVKVMAALRQLKDRS